MAYIKNIKENSGKITCLVRDVLNRSSPCLPDGDRLHSVWTFLGFGPRLSPSSPPGLLGTRQSQSRSSSRHPPPLLLFRCHNLVPLHRNPVSPSRLLSRYQTCDRGLALCLCSSSSCCWSVLFRLCSGPCPPSSLYPGPSRVPCPSFSPSCGV